MLYKLFSILTILSSIMLILTINPVHAVLYLIITFINAAILFLFLGLEFISIIILIVYIGAVAILFLFVVMMLNIKLIEIQENLIRFIPISIIVSLLFFFEIYTILSNIVEYHDRFFLLEKWDNYIFFFTNIYKLAQIFFAHFYFEFLISGLILLIAMIGAIVLCINKNNLFKKQDLYSQINTQMDTAIKLN